jgi:uncharacterized protein (UPF0332 family)
MQGRAFLKVARQLLSGGSEASLRSATGRAYYGLMHECRESLYRWGIPTPPRENVHSFVRLRFIYAADAGLKDIGRALESLVKLRNRADYDLSAQTDFVSDKHTEKILNEAEKALAQLDAINTDPTRQSAAIAAIRKAFPTPPDKAGK